MSQMWELILGRPFQNEAAPKKQKAKIWDSKRVQRSQKEARKMVVEPTKRRKMSEEKPKVVEALEVSDLVDCVCSECGIPRFRLGMGDDGIARVCRWIGERAPGSKMIDGKMAISVDGFDAMIFITMTEFPDFYEKHQLAMVWRN